MQASTARRQTWTNDETGPVHMEQDIDGYRSSMEPILLANFLQLNPGETILDVGTGSAIIPLLLVHREHRLDITAIELQESLYRQAVINVSKNKCLKQVTVLLGDFLKETPHLGKSNFDVIVSNPPFQKVNSGRVNPNKVKALARHELALDLDSLLRRSFSLLKDEGRIALSYPRHRLEEVMARLRAHGLNPCRVQLIHGHRKARAKMFLVEALKRAQTDCLVEGPFYIYNSDRSYTHEMLNLYGAFNYPRRSHRLR